jgi:hypothetical protein
MKDEYDLSDAKRGRFHRPDASLVPATFQPLPEGDEKRLSSPTEGEGPQKDTKSGGGSQ